VRKAIGISLSEDERATLTTWARSRTVAARLVTRAKIVLLAADGRQNQQIADELGIDRGTAVIWRGRFATQRLAGIAQERPGRGRPATKRRHWAKTIVKVTLETTPPNATQWSQRTLAAHLGISTAMVTRVWKEHNLKPHRVKTFKLSRDPQFLEKLVDVVGLYLNPPEHALVLCCDEKSQIQALDRTQPGLPLKKGRCGTMTHDYKRNGTTSLFAALNVLDGMVISQCHARHRHQEWLKFLKLIKSQVPADQEVHLICDNYATHAHPKVQAWLKRSPRFHFHFTPTGASWLNMVERFFRDLTAKALKRGSFYNVDDLIGAITEYVNEHNRCPKPFIWTASANDILAKVKRARARLNKL